jgi:tetrapyrrole methylase family protein/MazG family protein
MLDFERKNRYGYADLLEIIRLLRSENGCPWDKVQTHRSIRRGMLEEAYEAAEAIDRDDTAMLREELGDVLMQVVFHADLAAEEGRFSMEDVCDEVVKKLLYRHPHVFGDAHEDSPESVLVSWDKLKRAEKGQATAADALDSVARSLPGLWRAEKLQKKAAGAGFDWPDVRGALDKLDEETGELRRAVESGEGVAEELHVYNRNGLLVAHIVGENPQWDGTHGGSPCPQGAYVWHLRYRHDNRNDHKTLMGTVTLIR